MPTPFEILKKFQEQYEQLNPGERRLALDTAAEGVEERAKPRKDAPLDVASFMAGTIDPLGVLPEGITNPLRKEAKNATRYALDNEPRTTDRRRGSIDPHMEQQQGLSSLLPETLPEYVTTALEVFSPLNKLSQAARGAAAAGTLAGDVMDTGELPSSARAAEALRYADENVELPLISGLEYGLDPGRALRRATAKGEGGGFLSDVPHQIVETAQTPFLGLPSVIGAHLGLPVAEEHERWKGENPNMASFTQAPLDAATGGLESLAARGTLRAGSLAEQELMRKKARIRQQLADLEEAIPAAKREGQAAFGRDMSAAQAIRDEAQKNLASVYDAAPLPRREAVPRPEVPFDVADPQARTLRDGVKYGPELTDDLEQIPGAYYRDFPTELEHPRFAEDMATPPRGVPKVDPMGETLPGNRFLEERAPTEQMNALDVDSLPMQELQGLRELPPPVPRQPTPFDVSPDTARAYGHMVQSPQEVAPVSREAMLQQIFSDYQSAVNAANAKYAGGGYYQEFVSPLERDLASLRKEAASIPGFHPDDSIKRVMKDVAAAALVPATAPTYLARRAIRTGGRAVMNVGRGAARAGARGAQAVAELRPGRGVEQREAPADSAAEDFDPGAVDWDPMELEGWDPTESPEDSQAEDWDPNNL